jgi:DNA-binding response OmpR family regulator
MSKNLVLVADDDPLLRSILEHKLTRAGYQVALAEDGQAALDAAEKLTPSVIVLDAMMPVLDGFEVLRRLKADEKLRGLVVVMLTALRRQDDIVGALQLGAADYLAKPFNPDELVARLTRLAPVEVD